MCPVFARKMQTKHGKNQKKVIGFFKRARSFSFQNPNSAEPSLFFLILIKASN